MQPAFTFDYQIHYSKRKTLAICIKNAHVCVKAPYTVTTPDITHFLHQKTPWIEKHLANQRQKIKEKTILKQQNTLFFLGETLDIKTIQTTHNTLFQEAHTLIVHYQQTTDIQPLLQQWLLCEAENYLIARTDYFAQKMQLTHAITDIRFKKTKSKWGHCSTKGVIQYNWLIIMAAPAVIDYLVVHELSHLKHMNHSTAFWQLVQQFCPNYRIERAWLKENGHKLSV